MDSIRIVNLNTESKKEMKDIENCFQKAFRSNSSGHSPINLKQQSDENKLRGESAQVNINNIKIQDLTQRNLVSSSSGKRASSQNKLKVKIVTKVNNK